MNIKAIVKFCFNNLIWLVVGAVMLVFAGFIAWAAYVNDVLWVFFAALGGIVGVSVVVSLLAIGVEALHSWAFEDED